MLLPDLEPERELERQGGWARVWVWVRSRVWVGALRVGGELDRCRCRSVSI